ncbi:DUF943 family protein [Kosakonia radicincitans]|uniref:DUF943 family protein n=1 Tax=Kosakonia radicincitans TaxID=283686 RepID=UPI003B8A6A7D
MARLSTAVAACGYLLWLYLTPVEIVAVHRNIILVRHFPYLKSRQIAWWEANKAMIKAKYGIPHKSKDGFWQCLLWILATDIVSTEEQMKIRICFASMRCP